MIWWRISRGGLKPAAYSERSARIGEIDAARAAGISDAMSAHVSASVSTMRSRIGSDLTGAIDTLDGRQGGHTREAEERLDVRACEFSLRRFLHEMMCRIVR